MRRGDQLLAIGNVISRQDGLAGFEAWRAGLPDDERQELDEALHRRAEAMAAAMRSMQPVIDAYRQAAEQLIPGITRLADAIVAAQRGTR